MFSWFRRKPAAPPLIERVWLTDAARLNAVIEAARQGPTLLLTFFDDTHRRLTAQLTRSGVAFEPEWRNAFVSSGRTTLCAAERVSLLPATLPETLQLVAVESHPLPDVNHALVEALTPRSPAPVTFHAALDEPLFRLFGGDRLTALVTQLGLPPDEPLEHTMISRALANARAKVAKQVPTPQPAASMEEWFRVNHGADR